MKEKVLQFVAEFHANGKLSKGINSTFVALIPKIDNAASFREYRPICLVRWLYKILSKVLANRIKYHMSNINGEA